MLIILLKSALGVFVYERLEPVKFRLIMGIT
jgi:hypothetical protein